jgi:hypothetical protein
VSGGLDLYKDQCGFGSEKRGADSLQMPDGCVCQGGVGPTINHDVLDSRYLRM